jgi:diguanylate cyclase (GGDEF)-like protein
VIDPQGVFEEAANDGGLEIYQPLIFNALALVLITLGTVPFSSLNERELRRRKGDLEVLALLTQDLENSKGAERVSRTLLDRICEAFGFERGVVLAAPEGTLRFMAGRESRRPPGHEPIHLDHVIRKAWTKRDPVLVEHFDPDTDPALSLILPAAENLLVVPLIADGQPLGILVVEQPRHKGALIERRVVTMAAQFASHGALAIRNAWLLQQVQKLAETDSLTGVANRRSFELAIENELLRAKRYGKELTLVMLDLDHFKRLNDNFGHQAGDDVLRQVGAALRTFSRESDTPARYGGEEFMVLLPDCPRQEAFTAAARLRKMIAAIESPTPITVSAGLASYPAHAHSTKGLIHAADEALYAAKRGGRDRAVRSTRGSYFRSSLRRKALGLPPAHASLRSN